jgi:hypothetical protein
VREQGAKLDAVHLLTACKYIETELKKNPANLPV